MFEIFTGTKVFLLLSLNFVFKEQNLDPDYKYQILKRPDFDQNQICCTALIITLDSSHRKQSLRYRTTHAGGRQRSTRTDGATRPRLQATRLGGRTAGATGTAGGERTGGGRRRVSRRLGGGRERRRE